MNRSFRFLMLVLVVCAFAAAARAETDRREGEVRGTFVKLVERRIGEREYVGVVVQQIEGAGEVTLLMSRRNKDMLAAARKLTKGRKVEMGYVTEAGQKWIKRLEAGRRRDGEGGDQPELRRLVKKLKERIAQLERQVTELRQENARLRGDSARKGGGKDGGKDGLPAGLRGFQGMFVGTVKSKLDRGFVIKVEKVARVWKASKAERPADAVGKALPLVVRADSRMGKRHMAMIRELKVGDRVSAEAFHIEGNRLTLVEELRKVD